MGTARVEQIRYLKLDDVAADPMLARRLPPDVAWRYHALPLAEDRGRITVAMAFPEDAEARAAVVHALGPESCVVKGAAAAIDAQLAEIWGIETQSSIRLRVCAFPEPIPGEVWSYAEAMGHLLGAPLGRVKGPEEANAPLPKRGQVKCDLIIFAKGQHPLIRHLLSPPASEAVPASHQGALPFGILVAEQPRWPLRRLLLVVCGESADDGAVEWALRLAQPSGASVTVLATVPPVPAMYHGLARMEQSVAALLATDTALGRQMHRVAQRLVDCHIDGTLRLGRGTPDQLIARVAAEGDHDLIIVATKPCRWWLRQLKGDPVCSLLSGVERPMLLTEPPVAFPS